MTSTVVQGASIIDGTGAPPVIGSIRIEGDRIVEVTSGDIAAGGDLDVEFIDGDGLTLTPGFVDVHTHDDIAVLHEPTHSCKTLQGVTSVVVGNCGISPTPPGDDTFGSTDLVTMGQYLAAVEAAAPAVNVAAWVGHGTIRTHVMGRRNDAEASPQELARMLELLAEAFVDGAVGFSSGLAYEPGCYSPHEELVEFAKVARSHDAIYTTHMRDESSELFESIAESIEVAEAAGVPLQISHLKAAGSDNWGRVTDALDLLDQARARGVDVMADQYPYTRGSTLLEQVVRGGAFEGASSFARITPAQVLIASAPKNPQWEGRTLDEIAADEGTDGRTMADRVVQAEGRACIVVLDNMSEDDVQEVLAHPAVMVGSDGIPAGNKPHPRLGHTYPRILGRYVRELRRVKLSDVIMRMTSVPARRFGFADRGEIREGAFGDLVLFDADSIIDTGTWTEPTVPPAGVVGVWVNGVRVVDRTEVTGSRPGRVIRG